MKKILLTGASGFVGRALSHALSGEYAVSGVVRCLARAPESVIALQVSDIGPKVDWSASLAGQDVVIHVAALAHGKARGYEAMRAVNTEGTLNLARQAAASGVNRFIFISSIGVHGNRNEVPFRADDIPAPVEPYACSKWEAEQGLVRIAEQSGMEVVIIRPPLVYGPDAPGNFARLVRLVESGLPLPLGAVHNRRTLVGLDNLVDLVRVCIEHPGAANRVLLAGDNEDVSTSDILRHIALAMGKKPKLLPVPEFWLWAGARVIGQADMAEKLLGSLQVDISETRALLGWTPPCSFAVGMKKCFG